MEHKISKAAHQKKQVPPEDVPCCGACRYYTEVVETENGLLWQEFCRAGKTYEEMRHCSGKCDLWMKKTVNAYD